MLLHLLGLAVDKGYCPLSGSWWHGIDISYTGHKSVPLGKIFVLGVGKFMDYMNLPGKLGRRRMWWLCGVYAEALADPG